MTCGWRPPGRRHRPLAFAIAVVGALALVACGRSAGGTADGPGGTARLRVLAPASLTEAFTAVIARFEEANGGVEVEASFGGSPALVAQLAAGAPADVLATADEVSMDRAVVAGDVAGPVRFARNRLTLVVERGNPLGVAALDDLARRDLVLVACAPEVPCGRLAIRALEAAAVRVRPRSEEENVKAVLSKVALGEADAGFVYETDARAAGGEVETLDVLGDDAALTTAYPIAVTAGAAQPAIARQFIAWVRSDVGQAVLADHGFLPE